MMMLTCKFTEVISDVETPVVGATVLHINELYHPCSGRGNTCTCIYHCQNWPCGPHCRCDWWPRWLQKEALLRWNVYLLWTSPPNDLHSKGPSTSIQIKIKSSNKIIDLLRINWFHLYTLQPKKDIWGQMFYASLSKSSQLHGTHTDIICTRVQFQPQPPCPPTGNVILYKKYPPSRPLLRLRQGSGQFVSETWCHTEEQLKSLGAHQELTVPWHAQYDKLLDTPVDCPPLPCTNWGNT